MSTTNLKTCPSCETTVNASARFCRNCAFDFSTLPPPTEDAPVVTTTPKSTRYLLMIGGGVAVILVLAISIFGVWLYKRNSAAANTPTNVNVPQLPPGVSARMVQVEDKIIRNEGLNDGDVSGLSANELRILRNVHFARYGRKYEKPGLGDYFYTRPWYRPRDDFSENSLTDLDKANIKVIQTAEDVVIAAQSRNWDTFWTMLRDAADRKDRGTLLRLMPADFEWNCCDTQDENNNGDARDDAFRWWNRSDINGWDELKKALSAGVINQTKWPNKRQQRMAPPAANQDRYDGWIAICELREDGRWYFVTFLVPEADYD